MRRVGDVRLAALLERAGQSLFFVPAVCVAAAVVLALVMLIVDTTIPDDSLHQTLTTTVESSRSILGAIAAGTITAASIVLSLTLVAVQLSSGQHSPRVLRDFIGDRFQQLVIGIVVGTFVYCVVVLRAVRAPIDEGGDPVVPNLAVVVAILLGLAALLAVLASVDRTARGLKVEAIARHVAAQTERIVRTRFPARDGMDRAVQDPTTIIAPPPPEGREPVILARAERTGWVRQIAAGALLDAVPSRATVEVRVSVGDYVMEGLPVVALHDVDPPNEEDAVGDLRDALRRAIDIGNERTMQQDVGFGILRMTDIAMRALSPGINDPNTAIEVVARLGSVLRELIGRDLGSVVVDDDGRRLIHSNEVDYASYLQAAFDPIRETARGQIAVFRAILATLGQLAEQAALAGDDGAADAIRDAGREMLAFALECDALPRQRRELRELAARAGFSEEDS